MQHREFPGYLAECAGNQYRVHFQDEITGRQMDELPRLHNLIIFDVIIVFLNVQDNDPDRGTKHCVKESFGRVMKVKYEDFSSKVLSKLDTKHSSKVGVHPLKLRLHERIFWRTMVQFFLQRKISESDSLIKSCRSQENLRLSVNCTEYK